jgi:hypothetical protein
MPWLQNRHILEVTLLSEDYNKLKISVLGKCQLVGHVKILLTAAVVNDTLPRLAGPRAHWVRASADLLSRPIKLRRISAREKQAPDWSSALGV